MLMIESREKPILSSSRVILPSLVAGPLRVQFRLTIAVTALLLTGCRTVTSKNNRPSPTYPFEEIASAAGLNFNHFNGATGEYYLPEIAGSGVALLDYDGDGDLDILLVQGDFLESGKRLEEATFPPASGWKPGLRLFRNESVPTGKFTFTDVTNTSGLHYEGAGMGVAVGDYDNDGRPDVYITGYGHNSLFHNNGDGTFTDVTLLAGVKDSGWSTSATFFDYDRDGKLDLFVTHYVQFKFRKKQCFIEGLGLPDYCGPQNFHGSLSTLFHNEGNGRFVDVTKRSHIGSAAGPGLGVVARDFNGDGWPDLYVANDGAASYLWLNQQDGTFREDGLAAGVALSMDGKTQAGMGIAIGDFNNDGLDEIFKTNLTEEGGNLYCKQKDGSFSECTARFGLLAPTLRTTGFGVGWLDYDNDGWLDLVIANGAVRAVGEQLGTPFPYRQRNQLFRNEAGKAFREVTREAGPAFSRLEVSRAIAFGDLDNDGAIDMVVTNNNGPVRLFRNSAGNKMHWLEVQLEGTKSNRSGFGAVVTVRRVNGPSLRRVVQSDGSYLAANDSRVHFGLGEATHVDTLTVEWPSGLREQWHNIMADHLLTIHEGTGNAK